MARRNWNPWKGKPLKKKKTTEKRLRGLVSEAVPSCNGRMSLLIAYRSFQSFLNGLRVIKGGA